VVSFLLLLLPVVDQEAPVVLDLLEVAINKRVEGLRYINIDELLDCI
jgi:hypothetical protein